MKKVLVKSENDLFVLFACERYRLEYKNNKFFILGTQNSPMNDDYWKDCYPDWQKKVQEDIDRYSSCFIYPCVVLFSMNWDLDMIDAEYVTLNDFKEVKG